MTTDAISYNSGDKVIINEVSDGADVVATVIDADSQPGMIEVSWWSGRCRRQMFLPSDCLRPSEAAPAPGM